MTATGEVFDELDITGVEAAFSPVTKTDLRLALQGDDKLMTIMEVDAGRV